MEARDFLFEYYVERLWDRLPAIYREEDGLAESPGTLRALVNVVAEHLAHARRSNDRLWEDAFIERCDDWAVPYIGDLVATRLVSALNSRGRRVDVAKTIYYRRRKGTVRLLEELISDVTGWDGRVVEMFRRLGRFRHGLDPLPAPLAGRFTRTPPGGWADLRSSHGGELAGGPFDEYHHTPDVRRHRGSSGRHGIPKLAFHLYRQPVVELRGVTPGPGAAPDSRTFDPSGRDLPLFMPRNRPDDWDEWRQAQLWDLPAPLHCRLLNHAEFIISEALILQLIATAGLPPAAADELRLFRRQRFTSESRLRHSIASLPSSALILNPAVMTPLLAGALVDDCGRSALLPASPQAVRVLRVELAAGVETPVATLAGAALPAWTVPPALAPGKDVLADPELGRLFSLNLPFTATANVSYWYAFPGPIGAGGFEREPAPVSAPDVVLSGGIPPAAIPGSGVVEFSDNRTYSGLPAINNLSRLTVQSADRCRPYLILNADWVIDTGANTESVLTLDGLWIGSSSGSRIVLQGDFERVIIRHCSLDPGGVTAAGAALTPVVLVVEGSVELLEIESSIAARIEVAGAGFIAGIRLRDSILHPPGGGIALPLPASAVDMARVTVLGAVDVNRLYATESLLTSASDVTNTQDGCFRFSAAASGSRLPHPYESHFFKDFNHFFVSRVFPLPGYAQLSESAPEFLRRGAENGAEIGAWNSLLDPIKLDSLRAKVEEFAPFGLIPLFIFET